MVSGFTAGRYREAGGRPRELFDRRPLDAICGSICRKTISCTGGTFSWLTLTKPFNFIVVNNWDKRGSNTYCSHLKFNIKSGTVRGIDLLLKRWLILIS